MFDFNKSNIPDATSRRSGPNVHLWLKIIGGGNGGNATQRDKRELDKQSNFYLSNCFHIPSMHKKLLPSKRATFCKVENLPWVQQEAKFVQKSETKSSSINIYPF